MKLDDDLKREIIESAEYLLYKIEGIDELKDWVVEINRMINKLNRVDIKLINLKENIIKKFKLDIAEFEAINKRIENIAYQYPFRNTDTITKILTLIYQQNELNVSGAITVFENWYKVYTLTGE